MSTPTSPVWADPKFRAFFKGAEETIAAASRDDDERFHRMVLMLCEVEAQSSGAAAAA